VRHFLEPALTVLQLTLKIGLFLIGLLITNLTALWSSERWKEHPDVYLEVV